MNNAPLHWTYLAEGNANIVFKAHSLSPILSFTPPLLDPCTAVLRVPKEAAAYSPTQQLAFREQVLKPFAIQHGVRLPCLPELLIPYSYALQETLQANLNLAVRPAKFQQSSMSLKHTHVTLLPLLASSVSIQILEFKPKWLAHSSNAPADGQFCRTCAIRAMRTGSSVPEMRYCPLGLISQDSNAMERAVRGLLHDNKQAATDEQIVALMDFFQTTTLFRDLARLQRIAASFDIPLAMTLRDCSCYLLLQGSKVVDCYLADLDPKSPGKLEYWQSLENELASGGWYKAHQHPTACPMI